MIRGTVKRNFGIKLKKGHFHLVTLALWKNKKLAGMYGNKNKITRGDIIAAAKKRKKTRA